MRKGFTLIELIFVIVIMGILSKFGVELLYKTYETYVYSNTLNRLESQSEMALKQIANRLQYRIKDSTVARVGSGGGAIPIGGDTADSLTNATVLEWIGMDIDGWRNTGAPTWNGFIDLDPSISTAATLSSPGSTAAAGSGAMFFIGGNVDLTGSFGWTGPIVDQSGAMHPVNIGNNNITSSNGSDFTGVDVYEFYQFAKNAYSVSLEGDKLYFYYDYAPWDGGNMASASAAGNKQLIMEHVKTFSFTSLGDILIIQVCAADEDITGEGEYAICKEKLVL